MTEDEQKVEYESPRAALRGTSKELTCVTSELSWVSLSKGARVRQSWQALQLPDASGDSSSPRETLAIVRTN